MRRSALVLIIAVAGTVLAAPAPAPKATPPKAMRLYVLDCGLLNISREGVERYHVTTAEVGETRMPVPCFLVAHPKGTLMWDVGVIPTAAAVVPHAAQPARGDRLPAGRRDLRRGVARAQGPHGQPESVRCVHVAHLEGRARLHVPPEQRAR